MEETQWFDPLDYLLGEYQEIKPPIVTHVGSLDEMLGGGWSAGMWAIMAAPGTGKSAFGLFNVLMAAFGGVACAYFSLEMTAAQCWHRLTSAYSTTNGAAAFGVAPFKWSDVPRMSLATQKAMADSGRDIAQMEDSDPFVKMTRIMAREQIPGLDKRLRLYIASDAKLRSVDALLATIDEAYGKGCRLAVIDYLQLITSGGANQYEDLTEVSHAIAGKANDLGIPVLVICSMNRESMKGGKPTMHDASGTAAIEYDATGVISLKMLEDESTPDVRRIEAKVHKNRTGMSGSSLLFDYRPAYNMFEAVRRSE